MAALTLASRQLFQASWPPTQSCEEKGSQSPTPLTLRMKLRLIVNQSLPHVFLVYNPLFWLPDRTLTAFNLNRQSPLVYPSWGSDIWCPAVMMLEEWTPVASLQGLLPGKSPQGRTHILDHTGGRLSGKAVKAARELRRKSFVGCAHVIRGCGKNIVLLMDHLLLSKDNNRVVYLLFKTCYNCSPYLIWKISTHALLALSH